MPQSSDRRRENKEFSNIMREAGQQGGPVSNIPKIRI